MKSNFNFNHAINHVVENKIQSIKKIELQNNVLDKDRYNNTFSSIESDLNLMYEKIRLLQDCIKYSDLQLKSEISQIVDDCKATAKIIEEGRDVIKNNSYIKHVVPFFNTSNDSFIDRNNTSISAAKIREGSLSVAENKVSKCKINKTTLKSKYKNNIIENNVETMVQDKTYRSLYVFNGAVGSEIEEVITIKLEEAATVNYIDYVLSNCDVKEISFKLIDDTFEKVKIDNTGKIKEKTVKEIIITLKVNNYIVSQLDYSSMEGDFWSKLEEIKLDQNLYLDKDKFYYYLFGVDSLEIGYAESKMNSCFISQDIAIGEIKENEYITLEDKSSIERGSVEYYIVDKTNIIPILPEGVRKIEDEKIFYKTPLRFAYNSAEPFCIKRNGDKINMSIEEAINTNTTDILTIDYIPVENNIKIINNKVKVKVVIREYDWTYNTFVKSVALKKYGGGELWIDKV